MTFNHIPILKFLIMTIVGIVISSHLDQNLLVTNCILSFLIISTYFLGLYRKSTTVISTSILLVFFAIGNVSFQVNNGIKKNRHFSKFKECSHLIIEISDISPTTNAYKIEAQVTEIMQAESFKQSIGKIIIYTDSIQSLQPYDSYIIPANFQEYVGYKNPDIFDYGHFLANKNVYHTSFIKSGQFIHFKSALKHHQIILNTKNYIVNTFNDKLIENKHAEIINALLLGQKNSLDSDTKKLFTNNGLAHLLAISGMHVGIILLILNFLLGRIPLPLFRNIAILAGIWIYILLTGSQLPAARAGFMISVFIIGKILNRNSKPLNSLFFAALVLLCIEPKILFQLSFQLSFSAMLSIFLFYDKIYSLFIFNKPVINKLWQFIAMNISVQILVLPISIFYFHQVPTYFLINSLISFPFIVLIIWISIFSLSVSWIPDLGDITFQVLEAIVKLFLQALEFTDNLPFSLIQNIEFDASKMGAFVLGVLGFYFFYYRRNRNVTLALSCFVPFIFLGSVSNVMKNDRKKIIIYDNPHQIAVDFIYENDTVRTLDQITTKSTSFYMKHKSEDHILSQSLELKTKNLKVDFYRFDFFTANGVIVNNCAAITENTFFKICILNLPEISNLLIKNCEQLIIPRSLKEEIRRHQIEYLNANGIQYYDIKSKGAFTLKFK